MSLILDALRKSERTRQQSLTGRLGAGEPPPAPARSALPWLTLLGVLLFVNAIALTMLIWHGDKRTAAAPPPAAYHPIVRPLAEEAAPQAAGTAAAPAHTAPSSSATVLPPPAAAAPQPAPPVVAQNADTGVPRLDSLPADVRQTLPALHLDVLGYAVNPADRFVVINLQHYRIGDTTKEGAAVTDIAPDGVILDFHGTHFLLPP